MKRFRIVLVALAVVLLIGGRSLTGQTEKPLTNADIVTMLRAGLGDDVVIAKIKQAAREDLDVSTSTLVHLKKNGLTKNVIAAMVTRVSQRIPPTPTPVPTAVPPTPGPTKAIARKADGDAGGDGEKKKDGSDAMAGKPCAANFKAEGGFWKGEIFRTFQEFQGVDKGKAFESILQAVLAAPNMVVSSSSKETGTISGQGSFSPVLGGAPKPAPLGVTFKDLPGGGFRVNVQFNVPSGTVAKKKMVQEAFCTILDAAFQ